MRFEKVEALILKETAGTRVTNNPPFLDYLAAIYADGLDINTNRNQLDLTTGKAHCHDRAWLSWQTVRQNGAQPIFRNQQPHLHFGTGFEGYLIGNNNIHSQEEAAQYLLKIGLNVLKYIRTMHKHSWKTRNNLELTIRGEKCNFEALREWNHIFGGMIARQKAIALKHPDALKFRDKTQTNVARLPQIQYQIINGTLTQTFKLPSTPVEPINLHTQTDEEQFAWIIMQNIGMLGHPLIRDNINSTYLGQ